jgi:hypothetical protein
MDGWHTPVINAFEESVRYVFFSGYVVEGFQRRGGRSKYTNGPGNFGPVNGDIPGMVAWCFFLFVGRFVLFIYDD